MKKTVLILSLLLPLAAFGQAIKVGSFNLCTSDSRRRFVEKGKAGVIAGPQRYWCNSATAVADMIVSLDCDIIGIQEVCDSIWGVKGDLGIRDMVARHTDAYDWILYPNTSKGISYDVAIAYKPAVFDTLATGIFWTGGHPDQPKTRKGEPKHICKPLVWARLIHKASGREFYFMSTHTVVPTKYKDDEWPKNRGNILNLQEIRRLSEALVPLDTPSILVGDLNVAHNSPDWINISRGRWEDVYTIFKTEDRLSAEDRTWGTQNMKDESGYSKWYPDHIMINGFSASDFSIDRRRFPTADGTLHYPSDHLPITATVDFAPLPIKWEGAESPDGSIRIDLSWEQGIFYRVLCDGREVVSASPISMALSDGTVFDKSEPLRVMQADNSLVLQFKGYSLEARAFDDGVAWRWLTSRRQPFKVMDEMADFRFNGGAQALFSYTHKNTDPFQDDFENLYTRTGLPIWAAGKALLDTAPGPEDKAILPLTDGEPPLAVLPALVQDGPVRMVIAESDVVSYPGMFLKPFGSGFESRFAAYPASEEQGGKRSQQMIVTVRENYIATCDGKPRCFPWRVICIARSDREMAANDLVTRLATAPEGDFSWVKPGKSTWEWWNGFYLDGVDFTPGVNTDSYKAHIDFAARHGIEYVMMDEGWAVKFANDLFAVVPGLDLEEIIRYGKKKNVGIILWSGYNAFAKDIENICRHYSGMGVAGFKIDFFDRNDQIVQEAMFKMAETASRYHLVVDFHGCPPPTGLQKRFPNVLNYEGIFGQEQMRKRELPFYDMVTFDVTAPFIRFLAGPADYTPGAFMNGTKESFSPSKIAPMSQGTRCRQLAEYVVFRGPLQMLCDSPSRYESDPACADFLYRVPTVWDETRVLEGSVGEYIVTARRKGDTWYIGALTDWSAREFTVDLSSLGLTSASVEAWEDGPDASENASDWQKRLFSADGSFTIKLAPGGGWAGIVIPSEASVPHN